MNIVSMFLIAFNLSVCQSFCILSDGGGKVKPYLKYRGVKKIKQKISRGLGLLLSFRRSIIYEIVGPECEL